MSVVSKLFHWGTGRRKTSVARVRIRAGNGKLLVNDREVNDYFCTENARLLAVAALMETGSVGKYDVFVNVRGGGINSQAGAIVMGLSRALIKADGNTERPLRAGGFLTRDSRMAERKKYGKRGARRSCQFSKR